MNQMKDVFIVSAFGRGHRLAEELALQGFQVELADVTDSMGRWSAEEGEGPFGYFDSQALTAAERTFLIDQHENLAMEKGFTLWLKDGPMELKSPLTSFYLKKRAIGKEVEDYLNEGRGEDSLNSQTLFKSIEKMNFEENWLALLAHQIYSTSMTSERIEALKNGSPLPLMLPCIVRRPTRQSYLDSLRNLEEKGVVVHHPAEVLDISLVGKRGEAIEVKSQMAGAKKAHDFIWCLTSEETRTIQNRLGDKIFPQGALKPSWLWLKFRVELTEGRERLALPAHFVSIEDIYLPWTHDNLKVFVKTARFDQFDVWIKFPNHSRFQRKSIEEMRENILSSIRTRMPTSQPKCVEMPLEYLYDDADVGAPRFPIFERRAQLQYQKQRIQNFYFYSPETWSRFDGLARFQDQPRIIKALQQNKQKRIMSEKNDRTIQP